MRLRCINEARKNLAYREAVKRGTNVLYNNGSLILYELSTPEALQSVSRAGCPSWSKDKGEVVDGDQLMMNICTTHLGTTKEYIDEAPVYYLTSDGEPWLLINVFDGLVDDVFDFRVAQYIDPEDVPTEIVKHLMSLES